MSIQLSSDNYKEKNLLPANQAAALLVFSYKLINLHYYVQHHMQCERSVFDLTPNVNRWSKQQHLLKA